MSDLVIRSEAKVDWLGERVEGQGKGRMGSGGV